MVRTIFNSKNECHYESVTKKNNSRYGNLHFTVEIRMTNYLMSRVLANGGLFPIRQMSPCVFAFS